MPAFSAGLLRQHFLDLAARRFGRSNWTPITPRIGGIGRRGTLTTPMAKGSSLMPAVATHCPTASGLVVPRDDGQIVGVDFQHRQIERGDDAADAGLQFAAVAEAAGDVPFQFAGFGENPAVGADDRAQDGVLPVALHADHALVRGRTIS